jgi:hypothetical protein
VLFGEGLWAIGTLLKSARIQSYRQKGTVDQPGALDIRALL